VQLGVQHNKCGDPDNVRGDHRIVPGDVYSGGLLGEEDIRDRGGSGVHPGYSLRSVHQEHLFSIGGAAAGRVWGPDHLRHELQHSLLNSRRVVSRVLHGLAADILQPGASHRCWFVLLAQRLAPDLHLLLHPAHGPFLPLLPYHRRGYSPGPGHYPRSRASTNRVPLDRESEWS